MYNNQFGYNPYMQPFNNNFNQPLQNSGMNSQSSAINSAVNPVVNNRQTLNGKMVDSIDVVKAIEYPLDGSVSYFPTTDGSAIVTKQLMQDGTSKITIFKPTIDKKDEVKYITQEDMKKAIDGLNLDKLDDIEEEIKDLKQEFKDFKKKKNGD